MIDAAINKGMKFLNDEATNMRLKRLPLACIFLLCLMCSSVSAVDVEIDGLVLNRTLTRAGHDFYHEFVRMWEAPPGVTGYNMLIKEMPSGRWGSMVTIHVNDTLVFRCVLGHRASDIKSTAQRAIRTVMAYLFRYEVNKQQLEDADLSGDGY